MTKVRHRGGWITICIFLACLIIWSTNWLAIRVQIEHTDVGTSLLLRFMIAGSVLWLYQWLFTENFPAVPIKAYCWMVAVGGIYFYAGIGLTYLSAQYLDSSQIACLSAIVIFYIVVLKRLFLGAQLPLHSLLGAVVSVMGLCVFLLNDSVRPVSWPGIGLALLAFLAVACGAVISEKVQVTWQLSALQINKVASGWAALLYGLTLLARGEELDIPTSARSVGVLLYLGIVCSALVFVLFIDLIRRIGAENAGYIGVLYPICASYLAVLLGETTFSLAMAVGSALVVLGSFINFKCRYNPTQKKLEFT